MFRQILLAAGLAAAAGLAFAQAAFPTKPVTMIVPFPPGGLADTVGRPVAEAMARDLGQPVVIENKGGAGGGIGMAHASKAAPDGYTILMALSSSSGLPEADLLLGRQQMYSYNSLRPIARFTADPTVLAVRADAPWNGSASPSHPTSSGGPTGSRSARGGREAGCSRRPSGAWRSRSRRTCRDSTTRGVPNSRPISH